MNWKWAVSQLKGIIKGPLYFFYERRLEAAAKSWNVPQHMGIILDGNRRFARAEGLSDVAAGHARGADRIQEVLSWCCDLGIPVVTIWIFSLDNFNRDQDEVDGLMELIQERTRQIVHDEGIRRNQVRVRFIGRTEALPAEVQDAIKEAETATADYSRHRLNVAIAYGGREEIADAVRRCLTDQASNGSSLEDAAASLTAEALDSYLYTTGLPDPDLIIRTSGEMRLSGFLLWQSAYSEYYFCDSYWPEFRKIDLLRALRSYHRRRRRYGR